jgi:hypothetical protein
VDVNRHLKETHRLHLQGRKVNQARNQHDASSKQNFMQVSCLDYSSVLKKEVICSAETLVYFHRSTQRNIPEDIDLDIHRSENIKSSIISKEIVFAYFKVLSLERLRKITKKF